MNSPTRPYWIFLLWILTAIISSCSTTKTLGPNERLYTGASYDIQPDSNLYSSEGKLEQSMTNVQLQRPNRKTLGLPVRLWLYNLFATDKEKGLWHTLQTRLGQAPVVFDSVSVDQNLSRMEQQLFNEGYFNSFVEAEIKQKKHKASIRYDIDLGVPYLIDSLTYQLPLPALSRIAQASWKKRLVKEGNPYRLTDLRRENVRIAGEMRDEGYYFFQSKYLVWKADTINQEQHRIWLQLELAPDVPDRALSLQRIGRIRLYADYEQQPASQLDTMQYEDVQIIYEDLEVSPRVLRNSILLRLTDRYSPDRRQNTLSRLSQISYYRFVNMRFDQLVGLDSLLDMDIYLTPRAKQTIEGSVGLSYKPAAFWGPEFSVTYINRNLLGGAEELRLSGSGTFNIPLPNAPQNQNFRETDFEGQLRLPGLLIPFTPDILRARLRQASTTFSARLEGERVNIPLVNAASQIDELGLNDLQRALEQDSSFTSTLNFQQYVGSWSYTWQRQATIFNTFEPINFSYQTTRFRDPQLKQLLQFVFQELEQENYLLQLENILTVQPNFTFRYDSRLKNTNIHEISYQGIIGYGFSWLFPEGENTVDQVHNRFVRMEHDVRYYWTLSSRNLLAARLGAQTILPERNNIALPILDYYRIAGPNSLRGFRPRGVGPGTFDPNNRESLGLLSGQGELLLEGSLELRLGISNIIEIAAFADAGNVWLVTDLIANDQTRFPGWDFWNELAVDCGMGLRLDFNYLLLRLDFAFPLTKPWLPEGERWVGDRIALGSAEWRRDNLVFNLAFGYPF